MMHKNKMTLQQYIELQNYKRKLQRQEKLRQTQKKQKSHKSQLFSTFHTGIIPEKLKSQVTLSQPFKQITNVNIKQTNDVNGNPIKIINYVQNSKNSFTKISKVAQNLRQAIFTNIKSDKEFITISNMLQELIILCHLQVFQAYKFQKFDYQIQCQRQKIDQQQSQVIKNIISEFQKIRQEFVQSQKRLTLIKKTSKTPKVNLIKTAKSHKNVKFNKKLQSDIQQSFERTEKFERSLNIQKNQIIDKDDSQFIMDISLAQSSNKQVSFNDNSQIIFDQSFSNDHLQRNNRSHQQQQKNGKKRSKKYDNRQKKSKKRQSILNLDEILYRKPQQTVTEKRVLTKKVKKAEMSKHQEVWLNSQISQKQQSNMSIDLPSFISKETSVLFPLFSKNTQKVK